MDFQRIYDLSNYIPGNSRYFDRFLSPSGEGSSNAQEVNKFAFCYSDLKFGWHFIKSHDEANVGLGSYVMDDEPLIRAYNFERHGARDSEMAHAIALETTMPTYYRNLIISMFFVQNITLEQIANTVKLPVEVIRLYEQLFYNILDRRDEAAFIAHQIYPESRAEEFHPDYANNVTYDVLIKRSAYNNNIEDLLYLAGLRSEDASEQGNLHENSARLEGAIMHNANYLIKSGFMNTKSIGIASAKNLLAAAKHGGNEDSVEIGVGLTPIGTALVTEVMRDHKGVLEERLRFTQEHREAELIKIKELEGEIIEQE